MNFCLHAKKKKKTDNRLTKNKVHYIYTLWIYSLIYRTENSNKREARNWNKDSRILLQAPERLRVALRLILTFM